MKKFTLILIVFCLMAFQPPAKKLEGTWKMVSFKGVNNGVVTNLVLGEKAGHQLKSWSKNHFLFVGKFNQDGEWIYNYGSGTYAIDGTHYTENIIDHTGKDAEGTTVKLLLEFKGDTIVQINPVKDDWTYDKNNYRIEKYVRAE
jgi:hypothetical protein